VTPAVNSTPIINVSKAISNPNQSLFEKMKRKNDINPGVKFPN